MQLHLLSELNKERASRRAAIVVTDMRSGGQRLVREADIASDPLAPRLHERLAKSKSGKIEEKGGDYFIELHLPAPVMVIVGAVHVAQTLAPMAKMTGYEVLIVDPRTAFAAHERFPQTPILTAWPDDAFKEIKLDRWTAVIALSHDSKIDDPAIEAALNAKCFYVGALGSKTTHAKRLDRLSSRGLSPELLAQVHGPIGLAIGATSPAEIAVSILAQLTQILHAARPR